MHEVRTPLVAIGAICLLSAQIVPAFAAQGAAAVVAPGHVALIQLTLRLSTITDAREQDRRIAEFAAAARTISRCDAVEAVAKEIGAEFLFNRDVALSDIPDALRGELATMPVGTATRMYGQRGSEVRVLILCGRTTP